MLKKKLIHLSLEKISVFKQGVPCHRRPEENGKINRICLSDTIENALSAVSWFGSSNCPEDIMGEIGSKVIFVHVFEIEGDLLKTPNEVLEIGNVSDAVFNQEYWYIGEDDLIPQNIYAIRVNDYDEEEVSLLSPKLQEIFDEENGNIDIEEYYDLKEGLYYSTLFKITNVEYEVIEQVITGDSFSISYKGELTEGFEEAITSAFEMQLSDYSAQSQTGRFLVI